MGRMILAAATAVLTAAASLVIPDAPARAASVIPVPGHNYEAAGLHHWSNRCGEPWYTASQAPSAIYRTGGLTGTHATGFDFSGTGNEAGPWVHVPRPTQLTNLRVGLHATPGDVGHLVAYYTPPDTTFILVGIVNLPISLSTWGSFTTLADAVLTWHWIAADGTPYGPADYRRTIRGVAQDYGSDSSGAYVMVTFGCEGHPFYFDKLVVGTTTYDFEGVPTSARLGVSGGRSSVTVDHGRAVTFAGYGSAAADGHGSSGGVFAGTGGLYKATAGGLALVRRGTFRPGAAAAMLIRGVTPGRYVFRTDPSSRFESATSSAITVNVRSRIKGSLRDRTIHTGQSITVTGRVWPGASGARLKLQKKVGRGWRTIARGRSHASGKFRLTKRAKSAGSMRLRVVVDPFRGYLGDATPSFKVQVIKVVKRVRHKAPAPVVSVQHAAPTTTTTSAPQLAYQPGHDHVGTSPFG